MDAMLTSSIDCEASTLLREHAVATAQGKASIIFMSRNVSPADEHDDIMYPSALPFTMIHLGCLAAFWSGITWQAVAICMTLYCLRMFAIGAGYHRYFSHRAYSTGRLFQFVLAFLAQSSAQKSVLWWAAKHRHHHLHSDTQQDVHSPRHRGFIYSHVGWIFSRKHDATDLVKVADFAAFPELRLLHRFEVVPAVCLAVLCFLIAGWPGLVVGFLWSTVLVYHATFCINSLAHVRGRKRYVTGDDSRNNWILALFTLGEGWHNNHHAYQSSVRQGFHWWEIDVTFYVLKALSLVGVVWDLRSPPAEVLRNEQRLGSRVVNRAAEQLISRYNPEQIALTVSSALQSSELSALREALGRARYQIAEGPALLQSRIPTRDELLMQARIMFARTRSLDEIVDRAHQLLLGAVGSQLIASPR